MDPDQIRIEVRSDSDIVAARRAARRLAEEIGLSSTDMTLVATAVSEVARNMIVHADHGEITLTRMQDEDRAGILVVATDEGPGIGDIGLAMQDSFTTGKGMGLGLPGARRLMDEFDITSRVGEGTTVTMRKWMRSRG